MLLSKDNSLFLEEILTTKRYDFWCLYFMKIIRLRDLMAAGSMNCPHDLTRTAVSIQKHCQLITVLWVWLLIFINEKIKNLALICFGFRDKSCETFDGTTAATTFSATWTHVHGGLGMYRNQPATVGCFTAKHIKAETLSSTGWSDLPDFPM